MVLDLYRTIVCHQYYSRALAEKSVCRVSSSVRYFYCGTTQVAIETLSVGRNCAPTSDLRDSPL